MRPGVDAFLVVWLGCGGTVSLWCRDAQQYLDKDTANTAVVHCKAGKGRTGICVAALLLSLGRSHTWSAALAQFAISRTANGVGVTIASQRRWVQYFDIARAMDSLPPHAPLDLSCIRLHGLPPRLAPRLVVVLSLREHSAGKGYHSRVLVAAGLGRGFTADNGRCPAECESHCGCVAGVPASSFGQLLCGAPNKSSSVESKKPQPGRQLALMDGAPIKPALRVQSGQGWKLTLVNESTLTLQFEDEHGHYVRICPCQTALHCHLWCTPPMLCGAQTVWNLRGGAWGRRGRGRCPLRFRPCGSVWRALDLTAAVWLCRTHAAAWTATSGCRCLWTAPRAAAACSGHGTTQRSCPGARARSRGMASTRCPPSCRALSSCLWTGGWLGRACRAR